MSDMNTRIIDTLLNRVASLKAEKAALAQSGRSGAELFSLMSNPRMINKLVWDLTGSVRHAWWSRVRPDWLLLCSPRSARRSPRPRSTRPAPPTT